MLLRNLRSILDDNIISVLVKDGKINSVSKNEITTKEASIYFDNAIIFPGLINSHDHLDFNTFPKLGNRIYTNYIEWGNDIQLNNKEVIDAVMKIPKTLRTSWGIYKNLLCGVTTVVNHGEKLSIENELITVFQQSHVLHSIAFEKNLFFKLNNPFANGLVNIHVGEGSDEASHEEITKLLKSNFFRKKLVGIHGIAMDKKQAKGFTGLVWCPDSNYFLIGKTAAVNELKNNTNILFGTDSTLTADWNIWEHIRLARKEKKLTDEELLDSLTNNPAHTWQLSDTGTLREGYTADLVIARRKDGIPAFDTLYNINPEDILLVTHKGHIRLYDEELQKQLTNIKFSNFSKITINGKNKYIEGDLPLLIQKIRSYYPKADFPVT